MINWFGHNINAMPDEAANDWNATLEQLKNGFAAQRGSHVSSHPAFVIVVMIHLCSSRLSTNCPSLRARPVTIIT